MNKKLKRRASLLFVKSESVQNSLRSGDETYKSKSFNQSDFNLEASAPDSILV
jgi:hypothetical protein